MAAKKTTKTVGAVSAFLAKITPAAKRADAEALVALFERAIEAPPKMWGSSIVGFGDGSYANASGKETAWFIAGFAPRAQKFALYLSSGGALDALDASGSLFAKLGKHTAGKGCLYVAKLADVDPKVLEAIVRKAAQARGAR